MSAGMSPDFVKKQGAAVGLLKPAGAAVGGAGECALLMPKKLRFDQFSRNGSHIQGHERLLGPRAVAVQGASHQLLAGAGRAVDEDSDAGAGKPADGAEHLLHGRRFAQDLLRCRRRQSVGAGLLGTGKGALHHGHCFVDVEGFGQVLKGALVVGRHGAVEVRVRRHDDDWKVRVALAQSLQKAEAVHAWHADVGDNRGRRLLQQTGKGLVGVGEGVAGDSRSLHGFLQHPADGSIVIDNPHWRILAWRHLPSSLAWVSGRMMEKAVRPGRLAHSIMP